MFPPIGLGTGGAEYLQGEACIDIVETAIDLGYRHIDTAQSYGNEVEVGKGIANSAVARDDIILATKVEKTNLAYDDVHRTTRASLDRLAVDVIDVLYVHFPTQTYEPEATLSAFDELADEGLITHIGVSNFSPEEVDEAREILDHPIVANQVEMHPLYRQEQLLEYARTTDIPLVAYSPLAQGKVFDVSVLSDIARAHGLTEADVALAWLTNHKGVAAIPKTTSKTHLRANLRAPDRTLDASAVDRIDSITEEDKLIDIA